MIQICKLKKGYWYIILQYFCIMKDIISTYKQIGDIKNYCLTNVFIEEQMH